MTTGGYPPQSDPHKSGRYPAPEYPAPQYGGQQGAGQPADYTTHFPNPITSGYEPPQQNPPQYGAPQYGAPQYGAPQYGAPADGNQYGGNQYGGQPAAPQYSAPQNSAPQNSAPQPGPQYGAPSPFGSQPTQQFGAPPQPGPQFGAPPADQFGSPQFGAPQPGFGLGPGQPGELLPRLGARIIDALIIGVPFGIVTMIASFSGSTFLTVVLGFLTGLAMLGYAAYMESTKGWTVGKKALGLSVAGPNGGLPTLEEAAKRNAYLGLQALTGIPFLGWLFSFASFAAWIGIAVTIEKSPTKQGFHDVFAGGTQVRKS